MGRQHIVEKVRDSKQQQQLKPPSKYIIILHNDDYTTMDFVIDVLMRFFGHDEAGATQIMMAVHQQGKGVCGVYTAEIAETKVMQVTEYARDNNYPLRCTMEKLSS